MSMAFDERDPTSMPAGLVRAKAETLISVTSEGGTALAEETLRRVAPSLAAGLRRGVPFLGRRKVTATAGDPSTVRSQDIGRGLDEPLYVCPLAADPGGSRAVLALDARAIAFLLEGSLGGDGSDPPKLNKKGLTAAQRAFIDRIVGGMVQGLSDALAKSAGLTLTKLPQLINEKTSGGVLVQLPLDFRDAQPKTEKKGDFSLDDFDEPSSDGDAAPEAEGASHGTVVIAVSKTALNAARAANQTKKTVRIDRRVAATMREVQVNVVAELGRLKLRLGELATLRVGDTLRLDVPVNGDIDVRVENKVLFRGQPTTLGSQLAIQVVGHQDSDAPPPEPEPAAEPPPPPPPPAPAPRPVTAFRKP